MRACRLYLEDIALPPSEDRHPLSMDFRDRFVRGGSHVVSRDMCPVRTGVERMPQVLDSTSENSWIDRPPAINASMSPESVERLHETFRELEQRPYGNRLWMVKELHRARENEIPTKNTKYSQGWFKDILPGCTLDRRSMLRPGLYFVNAGSKRLPTVTLARSTLPSLGSSVESYMDWGCSDRGDVMYGLLSIVQQVDDSLPSLEVMLYPIGIAVGHARYCPSLRRVAGC